MKRLGTVKVVTPSNAKDFDRLGTAVIEQISKAAEGPHMTVVAVWGDVAVVTYAQLSADFKVARFSK